MICPICGAYSPEGSNFCSHCASPFAQEPAAAPIDAPAAEIIPEPVPVAPKKGRIWVPFVILACMIAAGLALFFLTLGAKGVTDPTAPWFSVKDGVLSFDAPLYRGSGELNVPSTVAGQTVTSLETGCFLNCDELTTVILPDTLQSISPGAFQGCDALRGIFIPEGVEAIGAAAFADCRALESICIPCSVQEIGTQAFSGCLKLSYIFYSGPGIVWRELYKEDISSHTYVIAKNETFLHTGSDPQ